MRWMDHLSPGVGRTVESGVRQDSFPVFNKLFRWWPAAAKSPLFLLLLSNTFSVIRPMTKHPHTLCDSTLHSPESCKGVLTQCSTHSFVEAWKPEKRKSVAFLVVDFLFSKVSSVICFCFTSSWKHVVKHSVWLCVAALWNKSLLLEPTPPPRPDTSLAPGYREWCSDPFFVSAVIVAAVSPADPPQWFLHVMRHLYSSSP